MDSNNFEWFAESWDIDVRKLWPQNYPKKLSEKFELYEANTILDCAGGTGFPCLELRSMGLDISYSDGAIDMYNYFLSKIKNKSFEMPYYHSKWEELTNHIPRTYDGVMCSGNSFIGIDAYNNKEPLPLSDIINKMKVALKEFYNILNNNGVLFIDTLNDKSLKPSVPYISSKHEKDDFSVTTTIFYDKKTNIRTVREIKKSLLTNDIIYSFDFKINAISSEQLVNLILDAGFKRVEKSEIETASYVDAFFAFK